MKETPFGIPSASTEPENDLSFKPVVESNIAFCCESTGTIMTKLIRYCYQSLLV